MAGPSGFGLRDRRPLARALDLWAAVGLFALAVLLRMAVRNPEAVWLDEANSVLIASRSLAGILDALRLDGNPPLYYLLLHGWMAFAGGGEVALRALSAILAATLPPALYLIGRRWIGRPTGVAAALLALCWPLHLYYAQQIRMYALLPTLAALFLASLLHAREREGDRTISGFRSVRHWLWVVLSGLALVWTHNYGLFLVAVSPVAWLAFGPEPAVNRNRMRSLGRLAAALLLLLLIDLLWLPVVFRQAQTEVGAWIARQFTPFSLIHSILLFGAGYNYPAYLQMLSGDLPTAGLAVVWLSLALGGTLFLLFRRGPDPPGDSPERVPDRRLPRGLLVLWLLPAAIPFVASLMARPIYLAGRYEVVGYPAFALLLGWGAGRAWSRVSPRRTVSRSAVMALFAVYILLSGVTLHHYRSRPAERLEAMMAGRLNEWLRPGDTVVTTGLSRASIEYYLRRMRPADPAQIVSYPSAMQDHLGWFDIPACRSHPEEMVREAQTLVDRLQASGGHTFLVDHTGTREMYDLNEPLRKELRERSSAHRVLLRVGPDPRAGPVYEISAYRVEPPSRDADR